MWVERYPKPTEEQLLRKSAHRLKKLAPLTYAKRVKQGKLPKV